MNNNDTKTVNALLPAALTVARELTTKACTTNTTSPSDDPRKAFRFEFNTCGDPVLTTALVNTLAWCCAMAKDKSPPAERNGHWLVFLGNSGTGKTHLARKCRDFFRQFAYHYPVNGRAAPVLCSRSGAFHDWRKVCNRLREGEWDLIDAICEEWFAAIDDIGTEYDPNGLLASKLDHLCNARLRKWTVITCNYSLREISAKLDPRIASRMIRDGNVIVEMTTTDYNLRPHG